MARSIGQRSTELFFSGPPCILSGSVDKINLRSSRILPESYEYRTAFMLKTKKVNLCGSQCLLCAPCLPAGRSVGTTSEFFAVFYANSLFDVTVLMMDRQCDRIAQAGGYE